MLNRPFVATLKHHLTQRRAEEDKQAMAIAAWPAASGGGTCPGRALPGSHRLAGAAGRCLPNGSEMGPSGPVSGSAPWGGGSNSRMGSLAHWVQHPPRGDNQGALGRQDPAGERRPAADGRGQEQVWCVQGGSASGPGAQGGCSAARPSPRLHRWRPHCLSSHRRAPWERWYKREGLYKMQARVALSSEREDARSPSKAHASPRGDGGSAWGRGALLTRRLLQGGCW